MKKKILVICPFPVGVAAGQRLKYEQYFNHWAEHGYEITVSSFMDDSMWSVVYKKGHLCRKIVGTLRGYCCRIKDIFRLKKYDVVYIHMWATPLGSSFFERLFRLLAKYIIFDVEDNVFIERRSEINPMIGFMKGRGKLSYLIKNSDHVITSSPFLNAYCLPLNDRNCCTYISSSIDTDRFLPVNKYENAGVVTIGWTGTFSSKCYLHLLDNVFCRLRERCNFKLRVIGNFEYELPGIDVDMIQWSKEREVEDLQGIDIGVYPLSKDDWVLGKSGLKAIQYMAFGLPVVATNVGTTPLIISNLVNGILVSTDDDWVNALELLIKTEGLRKKLGITARKSVVDNYSVNVIKDKYLSILNNCKGA